ncbi:MAG: phosphoribosylformylglycinamidine cyclo-ligase [Deltaproteobacteria bacterium]|nr:phosphoribosylformylglycinamidine cyclo-ligase [Deltaproteobacteria bacterium]
MASSLTYASAGVSIDEGNAFVKDLGPMVQKTLRPEVIKHAPGFAGLFSLSGLKLKNPVLVASTDGVGTKLKLAQELKLLKGLGQDLVAMCVNDLLCTGAQPLFFLDYYACGQLDRKQALEVLEGLTESLASIQCPLLGGETAEMPGLYQKGDFDLAGFAVGAVEREEILDGSSIAVGDRVLGLASSGLHSNGYSLVRKIIAEAQLDLRQSYGLDQSLGKALLEPTRLYVQAVLKLKKEFKLLGLAHITGGGLLENLPRALPESAQAQLSLKAWTRPKLFDLLQEKGHIEESEMLRVFNCGIGFCMIVRPAESQEVLERCQGLGIPCWDLGVIAHRKNPQDPSIVFES